MIYRMGLNRIIPQTEISMIYLIELEEGYFTDVTDCGRYAETTPYLSEAMVTSSREKANEIIETWGGKLISFDM